MNVNGTRTPESQDPRTFCGSGYPWPLINQLSDGAEVTACYLVLENRRAETKQNKPFLKLVLGDRSGTIDGVIWDDADRWEPFCAVEAVVGIRGRVGSFQDRLQLRIHSVQLLAASADDMEYLLPSSPRAREQMERELIDLIRSVEDEGLRALLERCLGPDTETGRAFRLHPAAKRNHHAYMSGLLEHSVSVATSCDGLARHYRSLGTPLDRDLLVTAALLHDIGKLRELKAHPGVVYTTEGQLLGHILIGLQMITHEAEALGGISPERLLLLQHMIASHQGRPEWDSPKVPQLLEALVLHYADDLDAKLNQAGALVQPLREGEWSAYDRSFARSFLRVGSGVAEAPAADAAPRPRLELAAEETPAARGVGGEPGRDEESGSEDASTIDLFR